MGSAERRERERSEVRRRILDAARGLFAAEGYERVTMRRVAEVIEYSPTAIYQHFEGKSALVGALCSQDAAELLAALEAPPLPTDPVARIREIGRRYAAFGLRRPNHYRYLFMTPLPVDSGAPPAAADLCARAFSLLLEAVEEAVLRGRLRTAEPAYAAQVLWACLHGAVALLITLPRNRSSDVIPGPGLIDDVLDNGLRGLGADRPEA